MRIRETFMGKIVSPAKCGKAHELVDACMTDDWVRACRCVDCKQVKCDECFFYRNTAEDLKRFAVEYVKTHPSVKPEVSKDDMPEIKSGDVVIYERYPGDDKPHKLLHAGCAQYSITTNGSGDVILCSWGATSTDPVVAEAVSAIYRPTRLYRAITLSGLRAIARLPLGEYPKDVNSSAELIWKREEVKELTVDEVSEKLGYKVKIVGKEK